MQINLKYSNIRKHTFLYHFSGLHIHGSILETGEHANVTAFYGQTSVEVCKKIFPTISQAKKHIIQLDQSFNGLKQERFAQRMVAHNPNII